LKTPNFPTKPINPSNAKPSRSSEVPAVNDDDMGPDPKPVNNPSRSWP
jgi:hypothetical protein